MHFMQQQKICSAPVVSTEQQKLTDSGTKNSLQALLDAAIQPWRPQTDINISNRLYKSWPIVFLKQFFLVEIFMQLKEI